MAQVPQDSGRLRNMSRIVKNGIMNMNPFILSFGCRGRKYYVFFASLVAGYPIEAPGRFFNV
jgi:hypothetical protein